MTSSPFASPTHLEKNLGEAIARAGTPVAEQAEKDKDARIWDLEQRVERLIRTVETQRDQVVAARAAIRKAEVFRKERATMEGEIGRLKNLLRKQGTDPTPNAPKPAPPAKVAPVYAPDALSASSQKRLRAMFPDFYAPQPETSAAPTDP